MKKLIFLPHFDVNLHEIEILNQKSADMILWPHRSSVYKVQECRIRLRNEKITLVNAKVKIHFVKFYEIAKY